MALPMTDKQLGWVAGYLEGEGCFYLRKQGRLYYGSVQVQSTDRDAIGRLKRYTRVGRIYGPYAPTDNGISKKVRWTWRLEKQAEVRKLLKLILPLMSMRRAEKIRKILSNVRKDRVYGTDEWRGNLSKAAFAREARKKSVIGGK